jgi:hypothetical protein
MTTTIDLWHQKRLLLEARLTHAAKALLLHTGAAEATIPGDVEVTVKRREVASASVEN